MRIIALVTEPEPVRHILNHIGEPATPPRIYPPRAPPDCSSPDQTICPDEGANQDIFDYEFDQGVAW